MAESDKFIKRSFSKLQKLSDFYQHHINSLTVNTYIELSTEQIHLQLIQKLQNESLFLISSRVLKVSHCAININYSA